MVKQKSVKKDMNISQAELPNHVRKGGGLIGKLNDAQTTVHEFEVIKKNNLERLEVSNLPKEKPDFDTPGATKDGLIAQWLMDWINAGLTSQSLNEDQLIPRKADIAKYLNVSVGTVQNAIRFIEDKGYVESKQRIGTVIRNPEASGFRIRKLTSKRDNAVVLIKQVIIDRNIQPAEALPSARELARIIGSAPNTTRLALEYLATLGIVDNRGTRGNKANWYLHAIPELSEAESIQAIDSETLIDQIERDLKNLISAKYAVGEKLPSHLDLAETLKVSIKTVHDAMCRIISQGIVESKRGRYGTFIKRMPNTDQLISTEDAAAIFMPAQEAVFYNYEKVERHLKSLIAKNFKEGDKLPSMSQLAETLDVSSNTIRKALQKLSNESVVRFERGRYGGTFVTKVPDVGTDEKSFTWVSINPETVKSYRNKSNREEIAK